MRFITLTSMALSFLLMHVSASPLVAQPLSGGTTYLELKSDSGHWVGQGVNSILTQEDGEFSSQPAYRGDTTTGMRVRYNGDDGTYYNFAFDAPNRQLLEATTYTGVSRFPFNRDSSPGLSITTNGRGCNRVSGSYEVLDVKYAEDGSFERLAVEFEHYCNDTGSGAVLTGKLYLSYSDRTVEYCKASSRYTNSEWISGVQIGDFSNTQNRKIGYENFTKEVTGRSIIVGPGGVQITLTPGFNRRAYREHWGVWLDANKDGDFEDAGEQIMATLEKSSTSISTSVNLPDFDGETRLRVRMWYRDTSPNPCGTTTWGQVEDYTISRSAASEQITFDFENLAHTGSSIKTREYRQAGFSFTTSARSGEKFRVQGPKGGIRYTGSAALTSVWAPVNISLRKDDGQSFNLRSMDLSKNWDARYPARVVLSFVGYKSDGSTVSKRVYVNQFGFETYEFPEFTDVVKVEWGFFGFSSYHQFDNVVVENR